MPTTTLSRTARASWAPVDRAAQSAAGRPDATVVALGRAATLALYDELALEPKPGLVSFADAGSHDDMDGRTFMRSLFALRGYFVSITALGRARAPLAVLERCGIAAEARMLAATGGVNTHRGAVFMLGLLCAAAGATGMARPTASALREELLWHWGAALRARSLRPPRLPGGLAARALGLRGASAEAALGFPAVFEVAYPALRAALDRGFAPRLARLDALFRTMAVLDDCNVAHRGGLRALKDVKAAARGFVAAGGAAQPGAVEAAREIHRELVARRLSPGGAADTLAAACWLARVCDRR